MQTTPNYGLKKPDGTDIVNVADLNYNADQIDSALTPTADPAQTPTGNGPGKLVQWISWIANRIKAITGRPNWWEAPATTLEAAKAHMDAAAPHSGHVLTSDVVTTPAPNKILRLDANSKLPASITGDAATVGGQAASSFAPASHVGTGGSAHAVATTAAAGFMSAADKQKLDSVAVGAEVNQNTFSSVKAVASDGSTSRGQADADSKTDLLTLKEGQNVSLAVDSTTDTITIGVNTTGLNADTLDGQHASAFATAGHTHPNATTSTAGFMSASDKAKLDGIAPGAGVNQNAFSTVQAKNAAGSVIGSVAADNPTDTVNLKAGDGVNLAVSGDEITISASVTNLPSAFGNVAVAGQTTVAADSSSDTLTLEGTGGISITTDAANDKVTIGFGMTDAIHGNRAGGSLHAAATTTTAGFMSASDKQKLDGITAGAEPNQNAFSNVKVGATTIAADSETDTLELAAGTGITLTPDATNDKVTVAVAMDDTLHGNRGGGNLHAVATSSVAGFMSAADKAKLDGIQSGAQVNQNAFAQVKVGSTTIAADSPTDTLELVAGANISLTPDATNDKVTVAVTGVAQASHTHAGGDITSAVAQATNADTVDSLHASSFGRVDAATSVNSRWTFNTTNGRLVAPVGTDKWATA